MIRDVDRYIGQRLGPYDLQAKLGAGGMGVVYRAVHRRLGQARAIKVLPAVFAQDETFVQRFEQEARLASELRHPNIVMIYDIADDAGMNYIVMELLEGRSLRDVIREDGPLTADRAVRLLSQLAEALDFAHRHGVIHRDIKPGNALVGPDDHLTLVDFGIARAAEGSRLTQTGTRIGTAEYMAPETITVGDTGPGTDVYALGIIAYETMTGRAPFTGVNSEAILYAQIHTPPPPPQQWRADLSAGVQQVLLQQLSKDPIARYPTAGAFVRALAEAGGVSSAVLEGQTARHTWLDDDLTGPLPDAVVPPPRTTTPTPPPVAPPRVTPPPVTLSRTDAGATRLSTGPASRVSVPPPPGPRVPSSNDLPPTAVLQPPAAPLLDPPTLLKLVLGGTVLLLLLFSFLPTPRDPVAQNFADRLLLPQGASGTHMLGTDALGRDTLSRLMAGGRFLVERLAILAGVLTVAGLLLRRRLRKRGGGAWLTGRRLMLGIAAVLALSVLLEFALAFINGGPLERLGVFGRVVFGAERIPPLPSWGGMLAEGSEQMGRAPWLAVFPGAGLLVVAAGIAAFASGLADVWRRRQRRPANEPSLAAEE